LAEASLAHHSTPYRTSSPNFKKFGEFLVISQIFGQKTGFFSQWRGAKILELQMRNGLHFWIHHGKSQLLVSEKEIWARSESPRGQKHPKNDLSAPFLTHRK